MGLIEADKLISSLGELVESGMTGNKTKAVLKLAIQIAEAQPTVDAEPVKHGHWIMKPNGYGTCSNCKVCSLDILGGVDSDYCPNCGAKMDEVEDGEIG